MKVVTIIPIARGVFKDYLTYFTNLPVQNGDLVLAPLRNRQIEGLVVDIKDATNLKSELKQSNFSLKKISKISQTNFFTPSFITACQKTANHFLVPVGQVIKEFTPKVILTSEKKWSINKSILANDLPDEKEKIIAEKYVLQDNLEERLSFYKKIVREAFAKKKSVFICLPTFVEVEQFWPELKKGIDDYCLILHNKLSSKKLTANWEEALKINKPILIIGTSLFLSIPRSDIETFVLDYDRSSVYKNHMRPFVDTRVFIENLASSCNGKLIVGDSIIRAETYYRLKQNEFIPASPLKYRSKNSVENLISILKPEGGEKTKKMPIIGEDLMSMIDYSIKNNDRILLISHRRGLAPTTICNDCGKIVSCEACNTPLTLHKTDQGAIFLCHKCGQLIKAYDECLSCHGWRLSLLGAGTDKLAEEIKKYFPNTPLFQINSDLTTPKKAQDEARKFAKTRGSILLGTEMALRYIEEPVGYSAIASIDSMFSIPDFRINEKVLGLILDTQSKATKHFILQTKKENEPLFDYAQSGNLLDFFRTELEERQHLKYPPFGRLVKISISGHRDYVTEALEQIVKMLKDYNPLVVPSFESQTKKYTVSILLKLPSKKLDAELSEIIKNLPPVWSVDIDPESIL